MFSVLKKVSIQGYQINYTEEDTLIGPDTKKYDIVVDINGKMFKKTFTCTQEKFISELEEAVFIYKNISLKRKRK